MRSKILITGGAGFVGYHLAKQLAEQKNEIILVDNFSRQENNHIDSELESLLSQPNITMIQTDLTDTASYAKIGGGYDYIYHLAGINGFRKFMEIPHEVLRIGALTTLNILEWFRSQNNKPGAKILLSSSNEVFLGAQEAFGILQTPTPEQAPMVINNPFDSRWSYAGSKIISELFFIHYARAYNLRSAIVRLQNLYGPRGGYDSMVPKFIERIQNHIDPFPLFGPSNQRASCYIEDAVGGMRNVIESPATDGQTYHIGNHHESTIKKMLDIMFNILKWHPTAFDIKNPPPGSIAHDILDVSKIKRDTGWEAKTTLEDGLRKTIEWYLKNKKH